MLVATCVIFVTGCYKVTTLNVPTDQEVTTPVSLASDLIPLFHQSCSISGCHNNGGLKPDLSDDNAYSTLINGDYINVTDPEQSEIYLWMTGKRATAMPVGAANNPSNINQLVLAWIKQGSKNN
jgi:hypothetical protein